MDKISDLSLPNFRKPAIRPSGVEGTRPVFPERSPLPKEKKPRRKSKTLRTYEAELEPLGGHYTDSRGKPFSACQCGRGFTGAEAVDRFESVSLTCIVCPDCRWGHVITEGSTWTCAAVAEKENTR